MSSSFSSAALVLGIALALGMPGEAGAQTAQSEQAQPLPRDQTQPQQPGAPRGRASQRSQDRIYGSQLMTPDERQQYRQKMHSAKTPKERDELRRQHHAQMQERAKERGVSLPEQPPARGRMGGGMGGPGAGAPAR